MKRAIFLESARRPDLSMPRVFPTRQVGFVQSCPCWLDEFVRQCSPMDMLNPLIARLKVANLAQVAAKADVSRKTLDRVKTGNYLPTLNTVKKITDALDAMKVRVPRSKVRARAPEERAESATADAQE